nr:hypothetical protein [Acetobacter orleanensis]
MPIPNRLATELADTPSPPASRTRIRRSSLNARAIIASINGNGETQSTLRVIPHDS